MSLIDRLKRSWNVFMNNRDPTYRYTDYSAGSSYRPDRPRLSRNNERSIITAVFNRIALDVSSINFYHCNLDNDKRFKEIRSSSLNNCLSLEANIDQTSNAFIRDVVLSMFDEGCVAIVPVNTTLRNGTYEIDDLRAGEIVTWYPTQVVVNLYNDKKGKRENVTVNKKDIAIIENPFYSVMNEPNSTLKRLVRKLVLLDIIDEHSGSDKLDLIIQLPYAVRSQARRDQAESRRKDIEDQLKNSKYGIAYTDGTEKITQLNRPVENNLMGQIEYLTSMLYSQLGITQSIMDGTAGEETMTNYYSRTIEPIAEEIVKEIERKFLSKTARSQNQGIVFFRDPFKLVPVNKLAEIADKFTRNEIMTSNEIRQVVGRKPSDDPKADMLRNSNLNHPDDDQTKNQTDNIDSNIDNNIE